MCGIAGIISARPGHPCFSHVEAAAGRLMHRGPDDGGFLRLADGAVQVSRRWEPSGMERAAFVHRRLSILDLTEAGWQPMTSRDGRFAITFNGEVYNFVELRRELETLGCSFHSESDTEVVLAAFAQWGTAAFPKLTGMFAMAVLDRLRGKVTLARDPFGIKPLYFCAEDDALAFASELPALFEFGMLNKRVDPLRLYQFLRYGVTDGGAGTLLSGVKQMPPGHFAEIDLDDPCSVQPVAYWQPSIGELADVSFEEAAQTLREKFLRSVALHLRSDVPVGTALSGGIDSSAIVAAIRTLHPQAELHAFSYVAGGTPYDEERWIDIAAASSGAIVHKVRPDAADFRSDLPVLSAAQGEPFGSTSIYAQYRVFGTAAAAGIKVMLDGQGADEMLGGYRQYLGARFASLLRKGRIGEAFSFLSRASKQPGTSAPYIVQKAAEYLLPQSMQGPLRKLVGRETMPEWMNGEWFRRSGISGSPLQSTGRDEPLRSSLLEDLQTTNLPALLRYEDRNSMAFSIESRVPFLTTDLVDFVFSLPEEYLISADGTTKAVFRRAMRGLVPDAILDRRDKIGFATPEAQWLQSMDAWVRPLLATDAALAIPALDPQRVRSVWDETLGGKRRFDFQLWRIFNVILWSEQYGVHYA